VRSYHDGSTFLNRMNANVLRISQRWKNKILQRVLVEVLNAIYEEDFLGKGVTR
jgi:hypothetical protein